MRSNSYWHVNFPFIQIQIPNCKAKCTVFLMSIGNNTRSLAFVGASKWLNSNRTNIELLILFFFSFGLPSSLLKERENSSAFL